MPSGSKPLRAHLFVAAAGDVLDQLLHDGGRIAGVCGELASGADAHELAVEEIGEPLGRIGVIAHAAAHFVEAGGVREQAAQRDGRASERRNARIVEVVVMSASRSTRR